jgi:hypothetical protein
MELRMPNPGPMACPVDGTTAKVPPRLPLTIANVSFSPRLRSKSGSVTYCRSGGPTSPDVSAGVTISGIGSVQAGGRFAWLRETM